VAGIGGVGWIPSRGLTDLLAQQPDVVVERVPDEPFVLGGRLRWSWRGGLAVFAVLAVVALPVKGLYQTTGSSMEEGFMLVFPHLVQQGKIPNVDFLHLYGPGSLDLLAVWYWLFGYTLEAERTFGLLQHIGIIFGMYALTRAWGRVAAVGAAWITAVLIMTPIGLSALAWHGAVALALWSIVFAVRAVRTGHRSSWLIAGLLAGIALTFRPDLVLAIGAALLFALWVHRATAWKPLLLGAAIGLIPMFVHLVIAGPWNVFEGVFLDPVFHLRAGRELPRPPSWNMIDGALQAAAEGLPPWWRFPALNASKQLFLWFFAVVIIAIAVPSIAWWQRRRGNSTPRTFVLMAAGIFGLGILPQALQRPDSTHLAWVAVVSWPLLAVAIAEIVLRHRPDRVRIAQGTGIVAVSALMFVVAPFFTYRNYLLHTRVSFGDVPLPSKVERDGRRFWYDSTVAAAVNDLIVDLDELSEPGDRIVVGPADLSRTIYSDVALYYLFPELVPATYFIEMDPGLADTAGSGLAEDIESADWLVLTNFWTGWIEPNSSAVHRSEEANQAVADNFCLVRQYDENLVLLYQRCEGGGGVSPADVPGKYPLFVDPEDLPR
jgi:hypothetical protein